MKKPSRSAKKKAAGKMPVFSMIGTYRLDAAQSAVASAPHDQRRLYGAIDPAGPPPHSGATTGSSSIRPA